MTDTTPEELKSALSHWRDGQLATLFVVMMQLAAITHPEELRTALAVVYNQTATEKYLRHINSQCKAAADYANQCRELCQQVSKEVEELEKRHDALLSELQH